MENQIICPHCGKTISNNLFIDTVANGKGYGSDSIHCECGERLTYWAITAQLREQKTLSRRIQNWFRTFSHSQG